MSMRVPDDIVDVLQNLVNICKNVRNSLPLSEKMLMAGAVIDAENLLAEIRSIPK